ncbi:hypothetical protein BHE74_00034347 [Ensete ventricosum]|nr:hypothetical protein BHE74_00034347 [Ensete ventricosum]
MEKKAKEKTVEVCAGTSHRVGSSQSPTNKASTSHARHAPARLSATFTSCQIPATSLRSRSMCGQEVNGGPATVLLIVKNMSRIPKQGTGLRVKRPLIKGLGDHISTCC